jgi:hypothetical protein
MIIFVELTCPFKRGDIFEKDTTSMFLQAHNGYDDDERGEEEEKMKLTFLLLFSLVLFIHYDDAYVR